MPIAPKSALLIMLLCWLTPAQAFFCFTFGGHGAGNERHSFRQHHFRAPPPPPLFTPGIAEQSPYEPDLELPEIAPAKEKPEIIQGYRFRPLDRGHQSEPQTPTIYRQK